MCDTGLPLLLFAAQSMASVAKLPRVPSGRALLSIPVVSPMTSLISSPIRSRKGATRASSSGVVPGGSLHHGEGHGGFNDLQGSLGEQVPTREVVHYTRGRQEKGREEHRIATHDLSVRGWLEPNLDQRSGGTGPTVRRTGPI